MRTGLSWRNSGREGVVSVIKTARDGQRTFMRSGFRVLLGAFFAVSCGGESHRLGGDEHFGWPVEPAPRTDGTILPEQFSDSSLEEGVPLGVTADVSLAGKKPKIAVDDLGNAIVAWQSQETVQAVRYDPTAGFGGV